MRNPSFCGGCAPTLAAVPCSTFPLMSVSLLQQVHPQLPHLPAGKNNLYSPSGKSGWSVKDYWKSAKTKSAKSTMRYWRQSWQVCLCGGGFLLFFSFQFYNYQLEEHFLINLPKMFPPTEQYDAFVKFTHDQLLRRFEEQPASCKWFNVEPESAVNAWGGFVRCRGTFKASEFNMSYFPSVEFNVEKLE